MDVLIGLSLLLSLLLLLLFPLLFAGLMAASLVKLHLSPQTALLLVIGIAGPLIGADFLRLKDLSTMATGMASIGGAGTFDGIGLSGIVAAYVA